jgi:hypothetical protein
VSVLVVPVVSSRAPRRIVAGGLVTVSGSIRPVKGRATLIVQREGSDGRYRTIARRRLRTRNRRYSTSVRLNRPDLYRLRVEVDAGRAVGRARATDRYVRAVRRRASVTGGTRA